MKSLLASARSAALLGLAIAGAMLAVWLLSSGIDNLGLASLLARLAHVLGAIVWVGMIWFVNFVQLAALADADDAGRATLLRHVVPRVASAFRHASHLTVVTGVALLMANGYLLDRWVFKSTVYIPTMKFALLYAAAAAALAMWALVHFVIWPALRVVLGHTEGTSEEKANARNRIRLAARINLALAMPVTVVMVTAAHI